MSAGEHSGSRRIDVLLREAPHLIAAQPDEPRAALLRVVVNMESDEPELLGAYVETCAESGQVWYVWPDGTYHAAPGDCVRVVTVTL